MNKFGRSALTCPLSGAVTKLVIQEDGVATAIKAIYRDLEYAKSLIKNRAHVANDDTYDEESWTFIGDESDPELARRIAEYPWQTSGRMLQGKGLGIEPRASIDLGA